VGAEVGAVRFALASLSDDLRFAVVAGAALFRRLVACRLVAGLAAYVLTDLRLWLRLLAFLRGGWLRG
jgi:hypothetical protein